MNQLANSQRLSRGLQVMFRAMRPRRDELVLPEIQRTGRGYEYHVYYPRGKALRTVVLVYGMTIDGENDRRLLKFAHACTEAGLKVIVPHLPGLMGYSFVRNDLQRLAEIVNQVARYAPEPVGLIGFSTGGSYALLLASRPALHDKIGPIVLFSPIYDAREASKRLHAAPDPAPQTPKDWDQFYWAQFVIAYRNRHNLALSGPEQRALRWLLTDWEDYAEAIKREFYENHVQPHNFFERSDLFDEGPTYDQLSARGQLAGVKSPVFILHDASDRVVLPDHSRRMHAELAQRGPEFRQELLVTPWLAHIALQNTGNLAELTKIVAFTAELFR